MMLRIEGRSCTKQGPTHILSYKSPLRCSTQYLYALMIDCDILTAGLDAKPLSYVNHEVFEADGDRL